MIQSEHPNPYTAAEMESDRWQDASVVVHVEATTGDEVFRRAWKTPSVKSQIPTVGYVRLDVYEAVAKRVTELEAQLKAAEGCCTDLAQLEKVRPLKAEKPKNPKPFWPNHGGMPVPLGTLVDVIYRDGERGYTLPAGVEKLPEPRRTAHDWSLTEYGGGGWRHNADIISWRYAEQEESE